MCICAQVTYSRLLEDGKLNGFTFSDGCLADKILQACPGLEILNSSFTRNFGEWSLGFCAEVYGKDNPGQHCGSDHKLHEVTTLDISNRGIQNLANKVCSSISLLFLVTYLCYSFPYVLPFLQAFSPAMMPSLSHLNLRGNSLRENSASELLEVLMQFPSLNAIEVILLLLLINSSRTLPRRNLAEWSLKVLIFQ